MLPVTARRPTGLTKVTLLALVGLLCIQAAWVLVVPPFRGLDEHDHAYKAAAVAAGDWSPTHQPSAFEWGEFVQVPTSLVQAAQPICEDLPYTTAHNCRGIGEAPEGTTRVASSAARYNPAFYAVIGGAALPFEGALSLYAMRIAALLMCATLVALAVSASHRWARSQWPALGLLCALTPTATYTFSMAAPNGVEMAAAFLLWCALLGLARNGPTTATITLAVVGAVPLAVVRGMGPVWLALIVVTVALLVPRPEVRRILRGRKIWLGSLVVLVATLYAAWWTLASRGAEIDDSHREFDEPAWSTLAEQCLVWFLQSMGAFPARNELAHPTLYMVGFVGWWLVVAVACRLASQRERTALGVVFLCASAIPIVLTALTYEVLGAAWQGRYTYPYAAGFFLICGYVLDRVAAPKWAYARWPVLLISTIALATHLIGQLGVLADESRTSPLANTDAWLQPSPIVVIVLNVVGFSFVAWAIAARGDVNNRPGSHSGGLARTADSISLRVGRQRTLD